MAEGEKDLCCECSFRKGFGKGDGVREQQVRENEAHMKNFTKVVDGSMDKC